MPYTATINTPGYLPDADEPTVFDTATGAWEYLASERERALDQLEIEVDQGESSLRAQEGTGTVYLPTPGYEGDHDLGVAYSVTEATREETHYGGCPGLGRCDQAWHEDGCEEFWQYIDPSGFDITGDPLAERDAVEKRLWQGPDEPSEVWTRPATGRPWKRTDSYMD